MPPHYQHQPQRKFLTEKQLAPRLCQSVRTLQNWRLKGEGPDFYKFGQSVRYNVEDVAKWMANQRQSQSSEIHGCAR